MRWWEHYGLAESDREGAQLLLLAVVSDGRLVLGTWQGIYLCEHRNHAGGRKLMLTLQGETT